LQLRRVPELSFIQDLGPRRGFELTHLIDELVEDEQTVEDEDAAEEQ
jgi:ribosome-binding factor A